MKPALYATTEAFMTHQNRAGVRRRLLTPPLRWLMSLFFDLEVAGIENVPAQGSVVYMINHISFVDPLIITTVSPRPPISMTKAEALGGWFVDAIVRLWGNFPVRRGEADRQALSNALALLHDGQVLLIAPEGTRNTHGLDQARDGIAYLVSKADAPIVPVCVVDADTWLPRLKRLRRAKARIIFGEPFRLRAQPGQRVDRNVRQTMMNEAMFQLARTIPQTHAHLRGRYQHLQDATTRYLAFAVPCATTDDAAVQPAGQPVSLL